VRKVRVLQDLMVVIGVSRSLTRRTNDVAIGYLLGLVLHEKENSLNRLSEELV
jgi:hypothetical protein